MEDTFWQPRRISTYLRRASRKYARLARGRAWVVCRARTRSRCLFTTDQHQWRFSVSRIYANNDWSRFSNTEVYNTIDGVGIHRHRDATDRRNIYLETGEQMDFEIERFNKNDQLAFSFHVNPHVEFNNRKFILERKRTWYRCSIRTSTIVNQVWILGCFWLLLSVSNTRSCSAIKMFQKKESFPGYGKYGTCDSNSPSFKKWNCHRNFEVGWSKWGVPSRLPKQRGLSITQLWWRRLPRNHRKAVRLQRARNSNGHSERAPLSGTFWMCTPWVQQRHERLLACKTQLCD